MVRHLITKVEGGPRGEGHTGIILEAHFSTTLPPFTDRPIPQFKNSPLDHFIPPRRPSTFLCHPFLSFSKSPGKKTRIAEDQPSPGGEPAKIQRKTLLNPLVHVIDSPHTSFSQKYLFPFSASPLFLKKKFSASLLKCPELNTTGTPNSIPLLQIHPVHSSPHLFHIRPHIQILHPSPLDSKVFFFLSF